MRFVKTNCNFELRFEEMVLSFEITKWQSGNHDNQVLFHQEQHINLFEQDIQWIQEQLVMLCCNRGDECHRRCDRMNQFDVFVHDFLHHLPQQCIQHRWMFVWREHVVWINSTCLCSVKWWCFMTFGMFQCVSLNSICFDFQVSFCFEIHSIKYKIHQSKVVFVCQEEMMGDLPNSDVCESLWCTKKRWKRLETEDEHNNLLKVWRREEREQFKQFRMSQKVFCKKKP